MKTATLFFEPDSWRSTRGFRPERQESSTSEVQSQRRTNFEQPQIHLPAADASQYHRPPPSIQMESSEHGFGSAAGAGDLQICRLKRKKASQRPSGRIAIEPRHLVCHRLSPVGP